MIFIIPSFFRHRYAPFHNGKSLDMLDYIVPHSRLDFTCFRQYPTTKGTVPCKLEFQLNGIGQSVAAFHQNINLACNAYSHRFSSSMLFLNFYKGYAGLQRASVMTSIQILTLMKIRRDVKLSTAFLADRSCSVGIFVKICSVRFLFFSTQSVI